MDPKIQQSICYMNEDEEYPQLEDPARIIVR